MKNIFVYKSQLSC